MFPENNCGLLLTKGLGQMFGLFQFTRWVAGMDVREKIRIFNETNYLVSKEDGLCLIRSESR